MRKLRFLRWLCSLSLVASLLSGVAFGAGIPNLDDLGIDPWGDYNNLPSVLPTASPAPSSVPEEWEGDDLYTLDPDTDFIPFALPSGDYDFKAVSPSGSTILKYYVGNRGSVSMANADYTFSRGFNPVMSSPGSGEGYNVRMYNQGYLEFTSSVSYSASGNSTLYLNGSVALYPVIRYDSGDSLKYVYFSDENFKVQLLLNGKPYGSVISGATRLSYDNSESDLSKVGNVSSIGIRVTFVKGQTLSSGSTVTDAMFGFMVSDTLSLISDETGGDNGETVGLLGSIIEFLKSIVNGITNVAQQIAHLPGLIADEIMGRIRSLFIPTEQDLTQLKADYQSMLETKFGFIYQCFQLLENFFTTLVDGWGSASDYSFNFPGVSFEIQGVTYTLIAPQPISLDNALMDVLRPVAGTVVSFICVLAFVHSMETMFIAIISGKNYFDYVNSAYDMMANEGLLEEDEKV